MKNNKLILIIVFNSMVVLYGCKDKDNNCDKTVISTFSQKNSHNSGKNCMECHIDGGEGDGCFITAGSVYEDDFQTPYVNASVKLFTEPNGGGDLKATIEVDEKGNFYTTDVIYGVTLYPAVTGLSGITEYMTNFVTSGACNNCHGVSTDRIWTK
jgi:hypothetical protein